jgi:hypothetical protein
VLLATLSPVNKRSKRGLCRTKVAHEAGHGLLHGSLFVDGNFPDLGENQRRMPETLRSFYYAHNSRSESLIKVRLEKFAAVLPITEDSAVIEPLAFVTKMRSASDVAWMPARSMTSYGSAIGWGAERRIPDE